MSDEAARALLREWAVCTRFHTRKLCFEHVTNCMCRRTFAAALAAEREAGWRAGVEAMATLLLEFAAAIRALPYPAPEPQAPGHTDLMAFMEANPLSQEPTGSGQPDEAVVARARELAEQYPSDYSSAGFGGHFKEALEFARALLAALARAEAAEQERVRFATHAAEQVEELIRARQAAEARVAEQAAEIERLRAGLHEDLAYHEQQTAAWGDPEAGDPDERDHHQRRVDALRAALEAGR